MQVDIIVPTYKRYSLLQETLESVRNQTYPDWRCWITEDGESRQTQEAVQPFLRDERFRYVSGPHAGSPAIPRNRAIEKGNGDLIAFLDDDDLWLPEKLETQVGFFKKNSQCVVLGCNGLRWDGEEEPSRDTLPLYYQKEKFFGKISPDAFVEENYLILSSVMTRRKILEKAGPFSESLPPLAVMAEDYELWLRIAAFGDVWNLESPCLFYRITPLTYYKELNREERYKSREILLSSALENLASGTGATSTPNKDYVALLKAERNFYHSGPRFLGRVRHQLSKKMKSMFSPSM